jgi:hypothetical protein
MTVAAAAILLFLILDPLGNIPIFLNLLKPLSPQRRRIVLVRELLIALVVLFVFLFAGRWLLELMHLRQESVSIAGGIVLFLIGIKMIFPRPEGIFGEFSRGRAVHRADGDPADRRALGHGRGDAVRRTRPRIAWAPGAWRCCWPGARPRSSCSRLDLAVQAAGDARADRDGALDGHAAGGDQRADDHRWRGDDYLQTASLA